MCWLAITATLKLLLPLAAALASPDTHTMHARGRATATMDGLRRRIAGLFLSLCQDPSFNPEAARLRVNAVRAHSAETFEYVLQ